MTQDGVEMENPTLEQAQPQPCTDADGEEFFGDMQAKDRLRKISHYWVKFLSSALPMPFP